jgi:small subunit ribosomal protein S8
MSVYFVKFLLQLKNASIAKKEKLSVEYSDLREKMTTILYTEGFVQSFEIIFDLSNNFKTILITLRYYFSRSLLESLKLLSKPSHVRYMKFSDVSNIPDRRFVLFFSTDKGILTLLECKQYKIGGKLLFIC